MIFPTSDKGAFLLPPLNFKLLSQAINIDDQFRESRALVTGGNAGLGYTVLELARQGAKV
jgi:hypothetical protein